MTFSALAPKLFALGYEVIPIPAGEKGPKLSGWQNVEITSSRVASWARETPNANIGVRTRSTPAIDVDVTDQSLADKIEAILTREGFGTCVRVGSAPKRLMVCRADQPFRKTVLKLAPPGVDINTRDPVERLKVQKVEVLGLGQQFVAYGRHPKGHDYAWTSLDELDGVPAADLPLLTPDLVLDFFTRIEAAAVSMGWSTQRVGTASHASTTDDALLNYQPTASDIDVPKALEALKLVGDADDYDHWLKVGMSLHHQFAGSLDGLNLWHEWSSEAGNYDAGTLDAKWESFHSMPPSQTPITFRYVLKYASEGKAAKKRERMDEIRAEIAAVQSSERLYGKIAQNVGKLLESEIEIDLIVDAILKRGKELDGTGPSKASIRKSVKLAYLSTRINTNCPDWLKPWAYIEQTEQFFNLETGHALSERAFNNVHNRLLLSEAERSAGQFMPEYTASVVALNRFEIKTLQGFRYMPGADCVFEIEGVRYANTYTTRSVPVAPVDYTDGEREAIDAFLAHLGSVFEQKTYGETLLHWLAWIVQNPGRHPHWAVLIQGVEGAGKTYFSEVMSSVLGVENVGNVSPSAIRGDWTAWAEGKQLVVVEEIRLHGENRYTVIDKVKPYVTNNVVPVRRMRTDEYSIPNVTAYMLLTNHMDALPLERMDRRFNILTTRLRTREQIERFREANPDYFKRLFTLLHENKGAMRKFMLEFAIPDSFEPFSHAPFTDAKQLMMDAARGDEGDGLERLIEESTDPTVNCYILNVSKLKELAANKMVMIPDGPALSRALDHLGYEFLGRARDLEGVQNRYWSKHGDEVKTPTFQHWLKLYLSDPFA